MEFIDEGWGAISKRVIASKQDLPIKIVRLLAKNEVRPGGPYYSLKSKKVDANENLAIHVMLMSKDLFLEPLNLFVEKENNKLVIEDSLLKLYLSLMDKRRDENEYLSYWHDLPLPKNSFLDKLRSNSFTLEVIKQPFLLNDLFSLNLDPAELKKIVETNIYGWIYFAILDRKVDNDGHVTEEMESIMDMALEEATNLLGKHPNLDWVDKAVSVMLNEQSYISEKHSIIRSKPIYLPLSSHLNMKQIQWLGCYYLAKQYNDDLHDFLEDLNSQRNTLVTSMIIGNDFLSEYIDIILPAVYSRIKELLKSASPGIGQYEPFKKLEEGIVDYDLFMTAVVDLLGT